jgi:hypothetical protein
MTFVNYIHRTRGEVSPGNGFLGVEPEVLIAWRLRALRSLRGSGRRVVSHPEVGRETGFRDIGAGALPLVRSGLLVFPLRSKGGI